MIFLAIKTSLVRKENAKLECWIAKYLEIDLDFRKIKGLGKEGY